jgi:hypothetical protein
MNRTLKQIDPSTIPIGKEAPFRYRHTLPGEGLAAHGGARHLQGAERGAAPPGSDGRDAALVESIRRFGLIHPPILIDAAGKEDTVVSGHRRIAAALAAGRRPVCAVSLGEKDPSAYEILSLWLEEARNGVPLTDLETIVLTMKFNALYKGRPDKFIDMLSGVVGRKLSNVYIERTLRLLDMPEEVLEALHRGIISTGDLLLFSESDTIDKVQAAAFLVRGALPRRERRHAIRLMLRIGDLGRGAWDDFARRFEEGGQPLLSSLSAACHPSLTGDRRRIDEIISGMGLPTDAAIQPPENLEGGSYRLTARIRNEEGFVRILEKLGTAVQNGSISRLLAVLKGANEEDS